jgi:hypothetical protein
MTRENGAERLRFSFWERRIGRFDDGRKRPDNARPSPNISVGTTRREPMATIVKDVQLNAKPEAVWDALADFGALHQRLVPGFVTACEFDGEARTITFSNGSVAREMLVSSDSERRRLVYAIAANEPRCSRRLRRRRPSPTPRQARRGCGRRVWRDRAPGRRA